MRRYHSLSFLRATGVISMVQVHMAMYLVSPSDQSQGLYKIMSWFGNLAAPLFMVALGISLSLAMAGRNRAGVSVWKRGAALIAFGLLFIPVWHGSILHYLGIYLLISYFLLGLSRSVRLIIAVLLLAGTHTVLQHIDYLAGWERLGYRLADFWTLQGFFNNLIANGFFPVFPWLLYPIIGTVVGEHLVTAVRQGRSKEFASGCVTAGVILVCAGLALASLSSWKISFYPATVPHVLLFLGAVLLLFGILFRLLDTGRQPANIARPLIFMGQVPLSMYILHILAGPVLFRTIDRMNIFSSSQVVVLTLGMLVFLGLLCYGSFRLIGHGPFEFLLRRASR